MDLETMNLSETVEPVVDAIAGALFCRDGPFAEPCSEECTSCIGWDGPRHFEFNW